MTTAKPRKVTREMAAAETWLMNNTRRRAQREAAHSIELERIDMERGSFVANLPDDVRAALVAAKVIE